MAVHPPSSRRAAAWETRLKVPVLVAALAVLPLVALSLSQPTGLWHTVEIVDHWAVWITFAVEVAVMLTVVDDRRAWISGHRLELLVVGLSSPLVPLALAVAPALRLLILVKAFKALKVGKAIKLAKLHKSVRLVRRKLTLTGAASIALGALALALGGLTAAYMLTERSPLKGSEQTAALVAAGVLVTFGVNHLHMQSNQPREG